jgi:alkanesulfonate monooxygenase SsuD/methylene tetrahydromethanopterin reductase-like flavin-dependent oxidoreductase (luciferase family)
MATSRHRITRSTGRSSTVTDLVEPTRAMTLEQLDEGRLGLEIATAWLRSKASHVVDNPDPVVPETAPR